MNAFNNASAPTYAPFSPCLLVAASTSSSRKLAIVADANEVEAEMAEIAEMTEFCASLFSGGRDPSRYEISGSHS